MTETTLPELTKRLETAARVDAIAALTLEQRVRSRQRIRLDDGGEAGLLLPRGETLKDGDLLTTDDDSLTVRIVAAPECLSIAVCDDALLLARACYHLGNRHVALQIEPGRLCWLHDHVLDAMVTGLGLEVTVQDAPFEPEPGAYGGHASGHGHAHHAH
ncbi:MAG: urease accessory protein UreE [Thiohalocapsa sp.]